MDRGIYKDFDDESNPNTLWVLRTDLGETPVMEKTQLKHIIAGDSDSAYFSIPNETCEYLGWEKDAIVEYADIVAGSVNDEFPQFIEAAFNCPKSRNDSMVAEREVVSDKSFFLTKKRYIMHVVNNEGKEVDKMKIMGVEIKKSSTSKITKRFLMDLVNLILDGHDYDYALERIKDMKKEFYQSDIFEIMKPTSVKTLKKAEDAFNMTGSYKGISWQAKAAMMWNDERTPMDEKLNAGMKVGIISINGESFNKIAFPIDLTELPDWFLQYHVDYDTMWAACRKTINNYLTAMGWDMTSRKETARSRVGIQF